MRHVQEPKIPVGLGTVPLTCAARAAKWKAIQVLQQSHKIVLQPLAKSYLLGVDNPAYVIVLSTTFHLRPSVNAFSQSHQCGLDLSFRELTNIVVARGDIK